MLRPDLVVGTGGNKWEQAIARRRVVIMGTVTTATIYPLLTQGASRQMMPEMGHQGRVCHPGLQW